MKRSELILKCMLAYNKYNPPPENVVDAELELGYMDKKRLTRLLNIANYIDKQLTLTDNSNGH